ncbi:sigma-54 dependent transcriptional regulator [Thiohalocapsa sp. ML1]|uniref:sigma-54-dependent transcriptional regulator n=1 Tax=Thiohalocapsa sp. ML1 TaxID=1431688 RepID=UPI0007322A40|nr:sigma-54 dependent transcriptional regulator [Thiohalocapsa sp. ML1]
MSNILVADDEHAICMAFSRMLRQAGHRPLLAANAKQAMEHLHADRVDAVFLDVRMPGMNGLDLLERIRADYPELPVVVMTAYGTMDTAKRALELGAFDYLGKPLELTRVRDLLQRALYRPAPETLPQAALTDAAAPGSAAQLIGQSAAMQEVFKLMALLADNDLAVLVTGESGVGKELVARDIHRYSGRRKARFLAVNCAAIPEPLIESELFGHERGAFTGAAERRVGRFEAVAGGTLFLDEIGELPLTLQGKLLRVLQERQFERVGSHQPLELNARVIAATNRDLGTEVEQGRFREDLFHRLNLVTLRIPPLRKRVDDIGLLSSHFLQQAAAELGKRFIGIEPAALDHLKSYAWPGNVRELEHLIKRSVLGARGPVLSVHDVELPTAPGSEIADGHRLLERLGQAARAALRQATQGGAIDAADGNGPFHRLVTFVEQELITEALHLTGGNQVSASRLLALHRTTLRKKMRTTGGDMGGDDETHKNG